MLIRILLPFLVPVAIASCSELARDERVVFFPSIGKQVTNGWELEVHGWIYQTATHKHLTPILRRTLGLDDQEMTAAEKTIFSERVQCFLADNERQKTISIRLGNQTRELNASAPNGHFMTRLRFGTDELARLGLAFGGTNRFSFTAPGSASAHPFAGEVHLLNRTGLSVISDIDDTIKISQVRSRQALIRNTFCRPFQPVPGMAAVYQTWAKSAGAEFHYLSASPWQLYDPLAGFIRTNGFPEGTFHLKLFRAKDETLLDLFRSPEHYKLNAIEPLLKDFPYRRFVLVGDSGEKDPEIYGAMARKHPEQIARILIRDVTGQAAGATRYKRAFVDLPKDLWRIFKEPSEIQNAIATGNFPSP